VNRKIFIFIFILCVIGSFQNTPMHASGTWTDVTTTAGTAPWSLVGHGMTLDRFRGYVVIYGGSNGSSVNSDLWSYPAAIWTAVTDPSPPPGRFYTGFSYLHLTTPPWGTETHGYLVFSGSDNWGTCLSDAMIFNPIGSTWYDVNTNWNCSTPSTPDPRKGHCMVWDPGNITGTPKIILFGGEGTSGYLDDVWFFDPSADPTGCPWSGPYYPAIRPGARAYHGMCFDESRGVVVIYGGDGASPLIHYDTWEYSPVTNTWAYKNCQSHADEPGYLEMTVMSYDPVMDLVVMYGGKDPTSWKNSKDFIINDKTWEYNYSVPIWQLTAEGLPYARFRAAMAYDSDQGAHVLHGGQTITGMVPTTWEYMHYITPTPTPTSAPVPSTGTTGKVSILIVFSVLFLLLSLRHSNKDGVCR